MRSIIEDIAIVDYTFRNEKLFDFYQIESNEEQAGSNFLQKKLDGIELLKCCESDKNIQISSQGTSD